MATMRMALDLQMTIARIINRDLAAYLRNGVAEDIKSAPTLSPHVRNIALNWLETQAQELEAGRLPGTEAFPYQISAQPKDYAE